MIDKSVLSAGAAVADIADGATVMIGGFGTAGLPAALINDLSAGLPFDELERLTGVPLRRRSAAGAQL